MENKHTIFSILNNIETGIGLDISKRHTGIVIWDKTKGCTQEYGFSLKDYDLNDSTGHGEIDMRQEFKEKVTEIVHGKHFSFGVVEDVYGGNNYDTVRKLLALNTVIDELLVDGVCTIDSFHRVKEPTWRSGVRIVSPPPMKGLKAKIEVQEALKNMEYPYYLEHMEDKPGIKKKIFFEDICDACAMLVGMVAKKYCTDIPVSPINVKISSVKIQYVNNITDFEKITKRTKKEVIECTLNTKKLEQSILETLIEDTTPCYYTKLSSDKLGTLGLKRKLTFFPTTDTCYLIFWIK